MNYDYPDTNIVIISKTSNYSTQPRDISYSPPVHGDKIPHRAQLPLHSTHIVDIIISRIMGSSNLFGWVQYKL